MMAKALQITFRSFREKYATEDACRSYLFRERFPQGFICTKCGCKEYYPVRTRHVCQCKSCRCQTSVTAGTLFLRLKMVPDVTTATLQEVVDAHIQPDSTVECDGYRSYPGLQNVSVNASK